MISLNIFLPFSAEPNIILNCSCIFSKSEAAFNEAAPKATIGKVKPTVNFVPKPFNFSPVLFKYSSLFLAFSARFSKTPNFLLIFSSVLDTLSFKYNVSLYDAIIYAPVNCFCPTTKKSLLNKTFFLVVFALITIRDYYRLLQKRKHITINLCLAQLLF